MRNIFVDEGNLGADPVLKYVPVTTPNGTEQRPVLELNVRFDVQKKKNGAYEDVGGFWATVSQWGKLAEINHQFLKSGCRILVVGEQSEQEYIVQKGERAGQTATSKHIDASYIALVLLGVDDVIFSKRKPRQQDAVDHEFVSGEGVDDYIPFDHQGNQN